MKRHRPQLGRALEAAGFPAAQTWVPDWQEDGTGVVIGVIDSGFDLSHPCFRDANGNMRVDALLEQHVSGSAKQYTTSQLETGWKNGARPGLDALGHGTHVASICGGSPFAALRGVAPGARFVLVKTDWMHVIEGLDWIFRQAKGRPCVVNYSLGHHFGAHDGTAIDEREGPQRLCGPGKIVVAAAGNRGRAPIHCQGQFDSGRMWEIPFALEDIPRPEIVITIWYSEADEFELEVISPNLKRVNCPEIGGKPSKKQIGAAAVEIVRGRYIYSNLIQIQLKISLTNASNENAKYLQGWKLRVEAGHNIKVGRLDAWVSDEEAGYFLENPLLNYESTLVMPATSEYCIAVGNFVSAVEWDSDLGKQAGIGQVGRISRSSSLGPTRAGGKKPDIVAPGTHVTAALSEQWRLGVPPSRVRMAERLVTLEGSSMSTPIVTGLVALMLQKKKTLTANEVRSILQKTATHDVWTGHEVWNPAYGFGKLNAALALGAV